MMYGYSIKIRYKNETKKQQSKALLHLGLRKLKKLKMKTNIKLTVLLTLITLFFSCGNDDDAAINQNPEAFKVTATSDIKGLDIQLNWDVPKDPDGDILTYTIMAGTTLIAENITSPSHSLLASAYNTAQSGTIIAKDGKGGESSSAFTITSSSLVDIPDANFEAFLIDRNIDLDGQVNGQMNYQRPLEITSLDVDATIPNVGTFTNLTGIESFANLENFVCNNQNITNLDMSRNTELERLTCSNINITSLDISNNIKLKSYTGAGNNDITSIDFSKNIALTEINLEGNELLTTLDISQNIELIGLNCGGTDLTTLNTSNNIKLKALFCYESAFTSLELSNNLLLEILSCSVNNISTLDLSANINLITLACSQNNISILNLSQNNQLKGVLCNDNNLTSLNLKNGTSQNIQGFNAINNSALTSICIDVLAPVNPVLSSGVDTGVTFTTTCN